MAKTYTVITDEINALDCPITKEKIKTLYQDILDFAKDSTLIGGFTLGDISLVTASPTAPFGIVQSVVQEPLGDFCNIKIILNQVILVEYQPFISLSYLGGGTDANVYHPLIANKTNNSFNLLFNEGSPAIQNLKVYIKIEKI
jgi:hypothetical protein